MDNLRQRASISTEALARMAATADELGEHFANVDDCETMLLWLDRARRELVEHATQ
jgi:hypothetical protein